MLFSFRIEVLWRQPLLVCALHHQPVGIEHRIHCSIPEHGTRIRCTGIHAKQKSNAPGALFWWGLDNFVISQHSLKDETEALSSSTAIIVECIAAPLHTPVAQVVEGTF